MKEIDLSVSYAMKELESTLFKCRHSCITTQMQGTWCLQTLSKLWNLPITFKLVEGDSTRKTLGEFHRQVNIETQQTDPQKSGNPCGPNFISGTAAQ